MAGQAGCLQGQDRSAVNHPSSSHARRCLICEPLIFDLLTGNLWSHITVVALERSAGEGYAATRPDDHGDQCGAYLAGIEFRFRPEPVYTVSPQKTVSIPEKAASGQAAPPLEEINLSCHPRTYSY
ncbi:hypothetical protein J6590_049610 [Homalodisca vitripennis]|nr:hypothetical protein J6590_049610 [Homalodisca vitripennis]